MCRHGIRVLMLLGMTGAIAWIAVPLHRRGLEATAQALGALLVELPNWLPFAVVGALLLAVGARYEAGLRGLRDLRHAYAAMQ